MDRRFLLVLGMMSPLGAEMKVTVSGIKGGKGEIRLAIFDKAVGFPGEAGKAFRKFTVPAAKAEGGKVVFEVAEPGEGKFAFVVLHDEDGDGMLKKNIFGIPKEGVAISNYQKLKPPKFAVAAIQDPKGALELKVLY